MSIYTPEQQLIFWGFMVVVTTLSLLGSVLIIVFYLAFQRLRNRNSRIIVSLSIADLGIGSCGPICAIYFHHNTILLPNENSALCQLQATVLVYFMSASILWLICIAWSGYRAVVHNRLSSFNQEVICHVACWGIPFLSIIFPLVPELPSHFGFYNSLWCMYRAHNRLDQLLWVTAFVVALLGSAAYFYTRTIMHILTIKKNLAEMYSCDNVEQTVHIVRKMSMYVAAYIVVWVPIYLTFVGDVSTNNPTPFWAVLSMGIFFHSQGFINFILYGVNEKLVHAVKDLVLNRSKSSITVPYLTEL